LEIGRAGLGMDGKDKYCLDQVLWRLKTPNPDLHFLYQACSQHGIDRDEVYQLTGVDPWFLLRNIED